MADLRDNLDEFFDFALLEQDSGTYSRSLETRHEDHTPVEGITSMDWQTAIPETSNYLLSHNEYTTDITSEQSPDQYTQQWSLAEMLNQPSSMTSLNAAAPVWPNGNAPTCDYQQLFGPHDTPSLSIQAHGSSCLIGGNIDDTLALALDLTHRIPLPSCEPMEKTTVDTPVLQASDNAARIPRVTTALNLPTRQASSASWKPASAKRKGPQSRIPFEARQILEDEFATNPYPCNWEFDIIAHQANLDVKKVRNWFNNTRARKKGEGMFDALECVSPANMFRS